MECKRSREHNFAKYMNPVFPNNFRMNIIKLDHCDICSSFELCHVTESFVALEAIVKTSKEDCEAINFKAKNTRKNAETIV